MPKIEMELGADTPIAYFYPHRDGVTLVICPDCAKRRLVGSDNRPMPDLTKVYRGNIHPYKQDCHDCDASIHIGGSPTWPILFEKPPLLSR